MSVKKQIKKALVSRQMTQQELAEKLGKPYGTVRNALSRDNMRASTLEEYADALGCDVVLIDRETGEIYR